MTLFISKRPSRLARYTGVTILSVGLAVSGCSSSSETSTPEATQTTALTGAAAIVAEASQKTADSGTARFKGSVEGSGIPGAKPGAGSNTTIKMSGAYDFDGAQLEATATMDIGGNPTKVQIVSTDGNTYMQISLFGSKWLKADLAELGISSTLTDPKAAFEQLRTVADLKEVGTVKVDGVQATKYTGTVDLSKALGTVEVPYGENEKSEVTGDSKMTIWIDGQGRVIQMKSRTTAAVGDRNVSNNATLTFYDFGSDVNIEAPPADDVTDISDLNKIPGNVDLGQGSIVEPQEG